MFLKNDYPKNFVYKCFKKIMDNIHLVKETTLTVEKQVSCPGASMSWFNTLTK